MVRCSFCDHNIRKGTGTLYVKADGKMFNFCSMKCEKNTIKLKRKATKLKWTRAAQKVRSAKKGAAKPAEIKDSPSTKTEETKKPEEIKN